MRFMMFMIPRVYQPDTPPGERAEEGFAPPSEAVAKMVKFNEKLAKAVTLIALDGLHPPFEAVRVTFEGGNPKVSKGPFAGTKDVVGGYWMIDAKSRDEAVEWARRCPAADGDTIEIRRVFEMPDFPPGVQQAANKPIVREQIEKSSCCPAPPLRAEAAMLIRRPVAEVFEAIVDPAITTQFWFTGSSGRLEPGKQVQWDWEMYNFSMQVHVKAVEQNKRILMEWQAGETPTAVEWLFDARPGETTFVSVANTGFGGDPGEAVKQALDSTGGFALVLAGLKAFLEHKIRLNLVPDRFPDMIDCRRETPRS